MNKFWLVAKREYLRTVRKPSFWLTTLAFPLFIIVVAVISGLSSMSLEDTISGAISSEDQVMIVDIAGIINNQVLPENVSYETFGDYDKLIAQVKTGKLDTFIYLPAGLLAGDPIEVYSQSKGLIADQGYAEIINQFIDQSILLTLPNPGLIETYYQSLPVESTLYEDGEKVTNNVGDLIIPGVMVAVYFMLVQFASSYLLLSVSEEKENRTMEIVLSTIKPRQLILGKIIGLLGVVITQLGLLILLAVGGANLAGSQIDLGGVGDITITLGQIAGGLFYTLCGFLILANVMVGVGAAMPTYKEAQSTSGLFILLSVFPIWFVTLLISQPSGIVAQITSYFPFTSAMILMFRNALGELSSLEVIVSGVVLIIYVLLSFYLAFKMFELSSLQYSNRAPWKSYLKTIVRR